MGGREVAGLTFGAAAGVMGGIGAIRTAFGLLKFLILLAVLWLGFLPASIIQLMDGNPSMLLIWILAGTPIWLTAIFALNRSSMHSAVVCFALTSIVSITAVTAYVKTAAAAQSHVTEEQKPNVDEPMPVSVPVSVPVATATVSSPDPEPTVASDPAPGKQIDMTLSVDNPYRVDPADQPMLGRTQQERMDAHQRFLNDQLQWELDHAR